MVLMMVVCFGFMVLMPSMMSGLDDEQKKQMKEQMELQQDPSKMLSQMWGEIRGQQPNAGAGGSGNGKNKVVKKRGKDQRLKRE